MYLQRTSIQTIITFGISASPKSSCLRFEVRNASEKNHNVLRYLCRRLSPLRRSTQAIRELSQFTSISTIGSMKTENEPFHRLSELKNKRIMQIKPVLLLPFLPFSNVFPFFPQRWFFILSPRRGGESNIYTPGFFVIDILLLLYKR